MPARCLAAAVIGGLGLNERGLGSVEVAAGDGSLGEELLAVVDDALVQVEIGFGLGEVELSFLVILGNLGFDGGLVGGVGSVEGALVVGDGGGEVAVFKGGEELAGFHMRAALDVKLFNRGGDFGRDGGLGDGGEDRVGEGVLGDGLDLGGGGLDGDCGGLGGFFFGAAYEEEKCEREDERKASGERSEGRAGDERREGSRCARCPP